VCDTIDIPRSTSKPELLTVYSPTPDESRRSVATGREWGSKFDPEKRLTKRIATVVITAGLAIGLAGASHDRSKSQSCPYPADPINWVVGYCGYVIGTDDEIVIQESKCFKDAEADLKNNDACSIKKKYKTRTCQFLITHKYASYKSVDACLKDKEVKPFFAGE
jgi:hypothetical protein